jgi:hypothetical protein
MNHVSDWIASSREKSLRNGQVLNRPQNRDFEQTGILLNRRLRGKNPPTDNSKLSIDVHKKRGFEKVLPSGFASQG